MRLWSITPRRMSCSAARVVRTCPWLGSGRRNGSAGYRLGMKIQTPTGETFRIHRRWLPWRRRAGKAMDWLPGDAASLDSFGDDPISLVIGAILLIPLLVILAFFIGEFLLLLLLLPFFVLARSVFGTPWIIEVTHQRQVVHTEEARGWGASHEQIDRLAAAISEGELPAGVLKQVRQKATEKARKNPRAKVKPRASVKPKTQAKTKTEVKTEANPGLQDTPRSSPGRTQDTPQDGVHSKMDGEPAG